MGRKADDRRARRAWGSGTVFPEKRRNPETGTLEATGRWVAGLEVHVAGGGRQRRRHIVESEAAGKRWIRSQPTSSASSGATDTLAEFLDRWLRDSVKAENRIRTWDGYRSIVEHHIVPALGGVRLHRLTPLDILAFRNRQHAAGFSDGAVRNQLYCLRAALSKAVEWHLVPYNPGEPVKVASPERAVPEPWTLEQAKTFLAHVQTDPPDPLEALYVLALTTGMRQGELLGLHWADIDWDACTVAVRRSLVRIGERQADGQTKTRYLEGDPKTPRSRRTLSLTGVALEALRAHQRTQAASREVTDQGLVFCRPLGSPLANWWVTKEFQRLALEAGLPKIRFHDLRHVAASVMLSLGVPLEEVSEQLGHSTIQTTKDVYIRLGDAAKRRPAELMDRALGGAG